jgi:hypothetical protein
VTLTVSSAVTIMPVRLKLPVGWNPATNVRRYRAQTADQHANTHCQVITMKCAGIQWFGSTAFFTRLSKRSVCVVHADHIQLALTAHAAATW